MGVILGSFPSVKSREENFYYAHSQNRFWKILENILQCRVPKTIEEKKELLIKNNIAIWDVIKSCDIEGSADLSIKNPRINDMSNILANSKIKKVFFYGKKAFELYNKYYNNDLNIEIEILPSSSPANAMWSFDRLCKYWNEVINKELI